MLVSVDDITLFYLVTFFCLSSGILTTTISRDFQTSTSLQSPSVSYLPPSNTAFSKLSQHAVFVNQALGNGLKDDKSPGRGIPEIQTQQRFSFLKPLSIDLELPFQDETKSITNKQKSSKETQGSVETGIRRIPESSRPSSTLRLRATVENDPHVPRRTSYQVVEELDEYLTDDLDHARLPYRGKVQTTNPHRNSQDITTAIKALDRFLSGVLSDDGYNSELHPPPNPVLALILSRYGRYVLGARNSRVYAHMAVNNIHNNKPFGNYKIECEQLPTYDR
ncbi:uncharacterized protein LOC122397420 [Colletes gigas]|uniref:uncharacterized protein LOC122397420 n=1 Tax=Colletes gigas TaxID=935657 RepID=UPI001C9AA0D4|nr:uncharacterized protein LOC122397420 [Colletes gigas]